MRPPTPTFGARSGSFIRLNRTRMDMTKVGIPEATALPQGMESRYPPGDAQGVFLPWALIAPSAINQQSAEHSTC